MANGIDVDIKRVVALFLALVVLVFAGCTPAQPTETEVRGRVIDQRTGKGIAGAIVIGRYVGSRGAHGATTCDRIESTKSDAEGWFVFPIDPKFGWPVTDAYIPDFAQGKPTRVAGLFDANRVIWKVGTYRWNEDNSKGDFVEWEKSDYTSREAAIAASREFLDVYLVKIARSMRDRIVDLQTLAALALCGGPSQSSEGPLSFIEAIRVELSGMNAPASTLAYVDEVASIAKAAANRRRAEKPER